MDSLKQAKEAQTLHLPPKPLLAQEAFNSETAELAPAILIVYDPLKRIYSCLVSSGGDK